MNKIINNINISDCVGDSLSKINYNFLSLDTNICNISSIFLKEPKNFNSYFLDLSANIENFNIFADYFEYPTEVNLATTATRYLSSYWHKNEVTFTFPINIYQTENSIKNYIDVRYPNNTLNIFGLNKLTSLYPAIKFANNTIANVIFLLYSNNTGENNVKLDNFNFGITDKVFNYIARKNDVYIKEIKISKYKVNSISNTWTFVDHLLK